MIRKLKRLAQSRRCSQHILLPDTKKADRTAPALALYPVGLLFNQPPPLAVAVRLVFRISLLLD
jgi:hypothetical protein